MGIEGFGFLIGLIGAIYMKASINLMRHSEPQPEMRMIGHEPENPAVRAFIKGLLLIFLGLAAETYARLFT